MMYNNFLYVLIGWSSLLIVYNSKKTILYTNEYLIYNKVNNNIDTITIQTLQFKLYILYLCWFANIGILLTLVIPKMTIYNILISSFTTNIFLIILFSLIIKFLNLFNKATIYIWRILLVISILNTIICSFLQTYYNYNLFKSIKILIYNFIIILISYKINNVLFHTRSILIQDGNSIKKINLNIIIYNIFSLFIILYQFISSIFNLVNNTEPTHNIDNIVYPIIELIGIILILSIVIKKKHKQNTIQNPIYVSNN